DGPMSSRLTRHACWVTTVAVAASACMASDLVFNNVAGSVTTIVDSSGTALATAHTFVLPDTIVEVPAPEGTFTHAAGREITDRIRSHLVGLGWTDLGASPQARPDVLILAAMSTHIQTGVFYSGWFGAWGYLPYWGAGVDGS